MRKLALVLLVFSLGMNAQEITKKTYIFRNSNSGIITAMRTIENGEEKDLKIAFSGKNHKYQNISVYNSFSYTSPSKFYEFLNKLIECFKYDKDTSLKVNGLHVNVTQFMGLKSIMLYDENMLGYTYFTENKTKKMLKKYEKWCSENNVVYQ